MTGPPPELPLQRTTLHDQAGERVVLPGTTWRDAVDRWQHDVTFRAAFHQVLAAAPFDAFFWETPPVSASTLEQPFEFVLVDAPSLAGAPAEPGPFREHIGGGAGSPQVKTFANLGGDAMLVVPCAQGPLEHYPHLAEFCRRADREQADRLWRAVGEAVAQRLRTSERPVWISTSGLGVFWVHVRLDQQPNMYGYTPYRTAQ